MDKSFTEILGVFKTATEEPYACAQKWKEDTGGKVVGILAMQFPQEIAHAAGAFPLLLQEDYELITQGHGLIYPFYCGYVRSLANQVALGQLDFIDEFVVGYGASCVQGIAIGDIIREVKGKSAFIDGTQITSFTRDACSFDDAVTAFESMKKCVEEVTGNQVTDQALQDSIELFNEDKKLMRDVYDIRREGNYVLTSVQLMHMVQSSMIMDKSEHVELMKQLVALVKDADEVDKSQDYVKVFASGHLCQAPKVDILGLIEESGAVIADDDFYHGYRYIAQDISTEESSGIANLARAYCDKDQVVPCPTRINHEADWHLWLVDAVKKSNSKGLIILQAKFCEPHMFYYPEIKEALDEAGIPHLVLQTEHEVVSLEAMRTRIETFVEMIKRAR